MKLSLVESRLFGRICYCFRRDNKGMVEIIQSEADVVKNIFDLYSSGCSLEDIQSCLSEQGILSPSGNTVWSRDVINKMLNNSRYTLGIVDSEEYWNIQTAKASNCRNPNVTPEAKEWKKQQEKNWNGHII